MHLKAGLHEGASEFCNGQRKERETENKEWKRRVGREENENEERRGTEGRRSEGESIVGVERPGEG